MSYEESKLLSLLKKQDIDSLFLEATNYLCQTKSLFEEKKQLQQKNEQQKEIIDRAKKFIYENVYEEDNGCGDYWWEIADKDEILKILEEKEASK